MHLSLQIWKFEWYKSDVLAKLTQRLQCTNYLLYSFITYRSCTHLDGKHSIFGRVVGGLSTLSAMEAIETDNKDIPIEDIIIQDTTVFVDPFKEADVEVCI